MPDHSQQESSAISNAKSAHTGGLARNSMPRTSGSSATAVRTRVSSTGAALEAGSAGLRQRLGLRELLAGAPEAALAPAEGVERVGERGGPEVRPQGFGEVQLGVRELPQEEVGDALLAAGADEKVGLGCVAHREELRQPLLGDRRLRILLPAAIRGLQ